MKNKRLPIAALLLWGTPALAQVATQSRVDRFERQLEQAQRNERVLVDPSIPAGERAFIDYGAYINLSYLSLDDPEGHNHQFGQYELVSYGRVSFDGAHDFYIRANTLYRSFKDGDSFDGRGDDLEGPELERATYRFDLQRALAAYDGKVIEGNLVVQVGRQLVVWANGLTLDVEIDGVVGHVSYGSLTLDLVAGRTEDDVLDFDNSRPDFRRDTHRGVYGAMLGTQVGRHQLFAYGLVQRDYNGNEVLVNDISSTRFDYNSYYIGIGAAGNLSDNLLYGVELAYEGGEGLSNSFDESLVQIAQTEEDIEAFALDGRLDYAFADDRRTRLGAELILATGDRDRLNTTNTFAGNRPGTDDHSFNAFGLLNTGLAFSPSVSNLALLRVGGSTFPLTGTTRFQQLQTGVDFFFFSKFVREGPIDELTNDRRYLGTEVDLYVNWQMTSDVTLAIRYGGFVPGPAIEGDSGLRNLLFVGLTYAF